LEKRVLPSSFPGVARQIVYLVWGDLGQIYSEIKVIPDSAIYFYKRCVKATPGAAGSYTNLGVVYFRIRKYKLASFCFNRAVEINPNLADPRRYSEELKKATGLDPNLFQSLKSIFDEKLSFYEVGLCTRRFDYPTAVKSFRFISSADVPVPSADDPRILDLRWKCNFDSLPNTGNADTWL
jgi:tetratricopeptide (TPR) repeat protein